MTLLAFEQTDSKLPQPGDDFRTEAATDLAAIFTLETAVGRVEGCVHRGAELGSLQRILSSRHLYILIKRATTRIKSPGAI